MQKIKLLLIRDFRLAIIHATVWILLFWVSRHPLDEWAMTAVVLYIFLWLATEIVLKLVSLAARLLSSYVSSTAQRVGVELPESQPDSLSNKRCPIAVFLVLFATIIGFSLSVGLPAVGLFGLTPLSPYFSWAAWGLLGIGGIGLLLIFSVIAIRLVMINALHKGLGTRITHSHTMTQDVTAAAGVFGGSLSA